MRAKRVIGAAVAAAGVLAGAAAPAQADRAVAVTAGPNPNLYRFDTQTPATGIDTVAITGLAANEEIRGIDYRPATEELYALGSSGSLYRLAVRSGAASPATPTSVPVSGTSFGFDFNPVPDRLRINSDADQNLRINVDTNPAATTVDGPLAYAAGDPNAGDNPQVVAAGYTNSFAGTTTTQLFDIDSGQDVLALQNPPNNGTLQTVGPLGVNVDDVAAFDISSTNAAFAALRPAGSNTSSLYTINTATGAATSVGSFPTGVSIIGLALAPRGSVAPGVVISGPAADARISPTATTEITADAVDDAGVASVAIFAGRDQLCTDSTAPYSCPFTPNPEQVGRTAITAVATDFAGNVSVAYGRVVVLRYTPTSVTLTSDGVVGGNINVNGTIAVPENVSKGALCGNGTGYVRFRQSGTNIIRPFRVRRDCTFTASVPQMRLNGRGSLRFGARFQGSPLLRGKLATALEL